MTKIFFTRLDRLMALLSTVWPGDEDSSAVLVVINVITVQSFSVSLSNSVTQARISPMMMLIGSCLCEREDL